MAMRYICWVWSLLVSWLLKEVFDKEEIFRGQTRGEGRSQLNLMFTVYPLFFFFFSPTISGSLRLKSSAEKHLLLHSKTGTDLTDPVGKPMR